MQPRRAFATTGIDFAGPVKIKVSTRRNAPSGKAYICVFVCFATKAVHVELVSDLSTDAFIAAFRRFWSRRGYCTTLWSDNGKNFVGANRKLKELRDLFSFQEHRAKVQRCVSEVGINWKFIPVYSPHFGGLWESAVNERGTDILVDYGYMYQLECNKPEKSIWWCVQYKQKCRRVHISNGEIIKYMDHNQVPIISKIEAKTQINEKKEKARSTKESTHSVLGTIAQELTYATNYLLCLGTYQAPF
ncbi:hypothetical protein QTP88_026999 [Uroleucon formosanum]